MTEKPYLRPGTGALPDKEDARDLVFMASFQEIDWEAGFDVYKNIGFIPNVKNQGSSLSCVGQSTAYYAEVLEYAETGKYKEMSAKSIYAQIRLGSGGAYLRDGVKTMVDYGINLENRVTSGLREIQYQQKAFLEVEALLKQAKIYRSKSFYMTPLNNDIDIVARAIQKGNGAIIGFWGSNSGVREADIVPPPEDWSERIWGHAVYACGFGIRNGKKVIKFINSWDSSWGIGGYGYISEDYFKAKRVFSPWTLIDKQNIMANYETVIVRDGKKFGVGIDTGTGLYVEYASSEDEYKLLGKKFGIEVIKEDGSFVEPNISLNKF